MNNPPGKSCPRCQMISPVDARFCAHCGHAYRTQFGTPPKIKPKRPPLYALLAIVGGLFVFGVIGTCAASLTGARTGHKNGSTESGNGGVATGPQVPFEEIAALSYGPNGNTEKDVQAAWGPPSRADGEEWYYTAEGGDTLKLTFMPAGFYSVLYFAETLPNPAAWPQTPDLSEIQRTVSVGSDPAEVRASCPGPEVIIQKGIRDVAVFRYHHGADSADVNFIYNSALFRGWGAVGSGLTYRRTPHSIAPSRPMQRADGSFYPMAGVDYPADATHPAGSMNHETSSPSADPTPAPSDPSTFTMRTKAGGGA